MSILKYRLSKIKSDKKLSDNSDSMKMDWIYSHMMADPKGRAHEDIIKALDNTKFRKKWKIPTRQPS